MSTQPTEPAPMNSSPELWFPTDLSPSSGRLSLVCLPHAGGGTAIYHRWRRWLPDWIALIPVCLPGREKRFREPAFFELTPLLDTLARLVSEHCGPRIVLFGHSMGALIAYELARRLEALDCGLPRMLIVSACSAPHLLRDRGRRLLDDEALLALLVNDFSEQGTKSREEVELLRWMLPTIRADLTLLETYQAVKRPPLRIPLHTVGGASDINVSLAALDAWKEHGAPGSRSRIFPGGHFYFQRSGSEETLVRCLVEWIADHERNSATNHGVSTPPCT